MTSRQGDMDDVHVLLVSGETVSGRGMELLLTAHHLRVVATAGDALEAAQAVTISQANLAVVDLSLQDEALTCVHVLRETTPDLPVLAFGDRRPWPMQELLDAGLRGFVLTSATPALLVDAIRTVAAGQTHLDPGFVVADRGDAARRGRPALSPREREIMGLLAFGYSGHDVAAQLSLSHATVRTHVQNAMRKLGARTRAHAIAILTQNGGDGEPAGELHMVG